MISIDVGYDAGKQIHRRKRQMKCRFTRVGFTGFGYICFGSVNVLEPKKSSNEFIARESELSGYIQFGWMADIEAKTLCIG